MTGLSYDMTVADFLAALEAAVPEADRATTRLEMNVNVGTFPSGEEGAEDWIMSSNVTGIDFSPGDERRRRCCWIDIDYS